MERIKKRPQRLMTPMATCSLSANETPWRVRIPIMATAREPIKQAGYILATSDLHA